METKQIKKILDEINNGNQESKKYLFDILESQLSKEIFP